MLREVQGCQKERNSHLRKKVKNVNPRGCREQMAPFNSPEWIQLVTILFPVFHMEKSWLWCTWFCFWNRCWHLFQTMCDQDQPEKWQVGSIQGNRLPWAVWYCYPHNASSTDSSSSRWHRQLWVSAYAVCFRERDFFARAWIQFNSISMDPIYLHILKTEAIAWFTI